MAEAKKIEKEVVVTETKKVPMVVLELSMDEAHVLCSLTGSVVSAGKSRTLTDSVFYALNRAGAEYNHFNVRGDISLNDIA